MCLLCVFSSLPPVPHVEPRLAVSLGQQRGLLSKKLFSPDLFSPDIDNGILDGATAKEFTGMRAEFTSAQWFECSRGRRHRRFHAWYGYFGGNMTWRGLMHLLVKVHFREEKLLLPWEAQRADRRRGALLTNLEKCLVCKMFFTTGLSFGKLADLWGCCDRTIANAVEYWAPKWNKISLMYCRLKVWPDYLMSCQPEGWSNR